MIKKIALSIIVMAFNSFVFCQTDETFKLQSKMINNVKLNLGFVSRSYVDCGTMKYTICIMVQPVDEIYKELYGENIILHVTCPEVLNSRPITSDNIYLVGLVPYEPVINKNDCFHEDLSMKHFNFVDFR